MPKLTIDNIPVDVEDGTTILEAARRCGVRIPSLCSLDGYAASNSCLVCVVRVNSAERLVPACGTKAVEGMRVESETAEVRAARKIALELLLGDHLGDCLAPCQITCPAHIDIPAMIRAIAAADWVKASAVVKETMPFPATLGRICPNLCERGCRRAQHDTAVAICLLKRAVGDAELTATDSYSPTCAPTNGQRVTLVGAGPAGLSAAYFLQRAGFSCLIYDEGDLPGGAMRSQIDEAVLPRAVLDAEIAALARLGVRFISGRRIANLQELKALRADTDALVLATGQQAASGTSLLAEVMGTQDKMETHGHTCPLPGVFRTGAPTKFAVQAVAAGASVARRVMEYFSLQPIADSHFSVHIGRLREEEMRLMLANVNPAPRVPPSAGVAGCYSAEDARVEATRCLHCDCRKLTLCKLREFAQEYGAQAGRFKGERRALEMDWTHSEIVYESGKCIDCGLCVQICADEREALGLTFIGRGFTVRVAAPFGESLSAGLQKVGLACAEACPTGALARKTD